MTTKMKDISDSVWEEIKKGSNSLCSNKVKESK